MSRVIGGYQIFEQNSRGLSQDYARNSSQNNSRQHHQEHSAPRIIRAYSIEKAEKPRPQFQHSYTGLQRPEPVPQKQYMIYGHRADDLESSRVSVGQHQYIGVHSGVSQHNDYHNDMDERVSVNRTYNSGRSVEVRRPGETRRMGAGERKGDYMRQRSNPNRVMTAGPGGSFGERLGSERSWSRRGSEVSVSVGGESTEWFDLNGELEDLAPYSEYRLPGGQVHIEELYLSKPLHLVGSASTVLVVTKRILVHLIPNYEQIALATPQQLALFAAQELAKNEMAFALTKSRLILSDLAIVFRPQTPDCDALFELSNISCLSLVSCNLTLDSSLQHVSVLKRSLLFNSDKYFALPAIHLDSSIFDKFAHLYPGLTIQQGLLINRCKFLNFTDHIVQVGNNKMVCIENSIFNSNRGVQIGVHKCPENCSRPTTLLTPRDPLGQSLQQDTPNAKEEEKRTCFLALKNVEFVRNLGTSIDIRESDAAGPDGISIKECLFDANESIPINVQGCNDYIVNINGCRFVKNENPCVISHYSRGVRCTGNKFIENLSYVFHAINNPLLFSKNICLKNKKGVKLSQTALFSERMVASVMQNRFDQIEEAAVIVSGTENMKLAVILNIFAGCLNGLHFDDHPPARPFHYQHTVELFENDFIGQNDYGILISGCNSKILTRSDKFEANKQGAICNQANDGLDKILVEDASMKSSIQGKIVQASRLSPKDSDCSLI